MLALALVESAQQASAQSQKKPGEAHSDCANYGETETGTALEKLHLCAGAAPDKLHLYAGVAENRLHFQTGASGDRFQNGAPVDKDLHSSGTPGDHNHLHLGTSGNQDQHSHLHTSMPGDAPSGKDTERDHSTFHTVMGDKDHFPSQLRDRDQVHPHLGILLDQEPSATDVPTDKSHLRTCIPVDKNHIPSCTAEDRFQLSSVTGENITMATVTYVTTIQTPATTAGHGTAGQLAGVEPTTQADIIVTTTQRTLTTSQAVLSQRPGDHQPAMGQVPAATTKGPSSSNHVSGGSYTQHLVYLYIPCTDKTIASEGKAEGGSLDQRAAREARTFCSKRQGVRVGSTNYKELQVHEYITHRHVHTEFPTVFTYNFAKTYHAFPLTRA